MLSKFESGKLFSILDHIFNFMFNLAWSPAVARLYILANLGCKGVVRVGDGTHRCQEPEFCGVYGDERELAASTEGGGIYSVLRDSVQSEIAIKFRASSFFVLLRLTPEALQPLWRILEKATVPII